MGADIYSSAVVVFALVDCLLDHGSTHADIQERTGIPESALAGHDVRVPLDRLVALWQMAAEVTGDPALSIHLHRRYGKNRSHFVNCLAMNSPTGMDALRNWQRYCKLVCPANEVRLRQSAEQVTVVYFLASPVHQNRWVPEHIFFQVVDYGRKFIHRGLKVDEVRFRHSPPPDTGPYEVFFQAPVRFGQFEHALVCQRKYLEQPSEQGNPHLADVLKHRAESDLRGLAGKTRLRRRVEAVMVEALATGRLDMEHTAARLNMSRSTLHRRLKAEGTSYLTVLTETRRTLARIHLEQGMGACQVAHLLGYANTANFLAAFKRWFGQSPGQFRLGLGNSENF